MSALFDIEVSDTDAATFGSAAFERLELALHEISKQLRAINVNVFFTTRVWQAKAFLP